MLPKRGTRPLPRCSLDGARRPSGFPFVLLPHRRPSHGSPSRATRCTLAARTLRYRAKFAALVVIIVAAALCIALLALFGILWAALHFGAGEDEDN